MKMMIDKGFEDFTQNIDKDTGFLHINGVIARDGIQEYLGAELSPDLEPMRVYKVLRPTEEVTNQKSLDSFVNMPVTDDHPQDFVTVDNAKELIKGSIATYEVIKKDDNSMVKARMIITDKELINKVINGKVEISAGYTQKMIQEDGEWNGEQYQFKQTDIKINHIAIVEKGRCGDACKLTRDVNVTITDEIQQKGRIMARLIIDGIQHDITDCVAKHISDLNSLVKTKDGELEELEKAKAAIEAQIEALKAKESEAPSEAEMEDRLNTLLLLKSKKIDVKVSDSVVSMKKAYLASKSKSMDGKSDAYILAAFDMEIEKEKEDEEEEMKKQEEVKASQDAAVNGFKSKANDSKFISLGKEVY